MPYKADKTKGIMKLLLIHNSANNKASGFENYLFRVRKKILLFFIFMLVIQPLVIAKTIVLDSLLTPEEIVWLNNNRHNIRYAPNPSWIPGDYMEDGVHKGIVSDYIKIFEQKLGVTFQRVYYQSWGEIIEGLKNSEVDFVGAIQQTTERDAYLCFTQPFHKSTLGIVVRTNYEHPLTNEHIGTMKLACMENYTSTEYVRQQFPNAEIIEYNFDFSALLSTSYGQNDGAVVDIMSASHIVNEYGITNLLFGKQLDFTWKLRWASIKQKPELASILDKLLSTITEDQRKEIANRWIQFDIIEEPSFYEKNKVFVWGALTILILFVLLAIIINLYLKKQVRIRTAELVVAKEKAEKSDHLKTAFLNNISHEIRTPLNAILGFAPFIIQPEITLEEKEEFLEILNFSSERLMNTVTDYMDISLIVSDNMEVHPKPIDVSSMLTTVYEHFQNSCSKKNIAFKTQFPDNADNFVLNTDGEMLSKTVSKLVDNSVKFTKEGSITLGYKLINNEIDIFVIDTGIGIEKDAQERIFEYFMQENVSNTRGHEGSGLGLSIVKGMMKLLGGKVRLESTKNMGTTAVLTLPINISATYVKPKNTTNAINVDEMPLILIAEDDEKSYLYMETLLRNDNKILRAYNGQEAVDLCKKRQDIALVLMDIKMPVMNGIEASHIIKSLRNDLPIIAVTAHALSGDEDKIKEAGCDEYISKPIDKTKLLSLIQKYLRSNTV